MQGQLVCLVVADNARLARTSQTRRRCLLPQSLTQATTDSTDQWAAFQEERQQRQEDLAGLRAHAAQLQALGAAREQELAAATARLGGAPFRVALTLTGCLRRHKLPPAELQHHCMSQAVYPVDLPCL